jgi:SP family facilitated glucose transporter-like MFS transporter 12
MFVVIGVGNGIALATATLFIAEISPQNKRGYLGSFVQLAISSGIFLAYLAGFGVLYFDKYYRAMFWIGAALALVSSVLLRFLKESPRHYIRKENHERARKILMFQYLINLSKKENL